MNCDQQMYDLRKVKAALQEQVDQMMTKFAEMEHQLVTLSAKDGGRRKDLEEQLRKTED
jgi:uncharacterized protein involved in exopolysaccharide biosynthesis